MGLFFFFALNGYFILFIQKSSWNSHMLNLYPDLSSEGHLGELTDPYGVTSTLHVPLTVCISLLP